MWRKWIPGLILTIVLGGCREAPPSSPAPVPPHPGLSKPTPASAGRFLSPLPSPTSPAAPVLPSPSPTALRYTVRPGDTLWDIAMRFGTDVESLKAASGLEGDWIYPGQILTVPAPGGMPPLSALTPIPSPTRASWSFSPLQGNLEQVYSARRETPRFVLRFTPGTWAAAHLSEIEAMTLETLQSIEGLLNVQMTGTFELYLAGTLFAPPATALRGLAGSPTRLFLLMDGSGDETDRRYILAHELTHLVARRTFGGPASAMLSEGLAVHVGARVASTTDPDYLPLERMCRALATVGALPSPSRLRDFGGHILDLIPYVTAGCFVRHLVDQYGVEAFHRLYPRGDFKGIYGRSLEELERAWRAELEAQPPPADWNILEWLEAEKAVRQAYTALFADFRGAPADLARYRQVDQARMALWRGRASQALALLASP